MVPAPGGGLTFDAGRRVQRLATTLKVDGRLPGAGPVRRPRRHLGLFCAGGQTP